MTGSIMNTILQVLVAIALLAIPVGLAWLGWKIVKFFFLWVVRPLPFGYSKIMDDLGGYDSHDARQYRLIGMVPGTFIFQWIQQWFEGVKVLRTKRHSDVVER